MRGSRDAKFLTDINDVFVCLVCASIQHTLKAYRTGEFIEPPPFRYDNSAGIFPKSPADIMRPHADTT